MSRKSVLDRMPDPRFELFPWQHEMISKPDGTRSCCEILRKNGKTALVAELMLAEMEDEGFLD